MDNSQISTPKSLIDPSRDNIQVLVRIRPLSSKELLEGGHSCIMLDPEDPKKLILDCKPEAKNFFFDHVGGEEMTQTSIFEKVGRPLSQICLEGYNICIFAYGQTGAGKTYTMQGRWEREEDLGLQPKIFKYLYELMGKVEGECEFGVKCSYFEIYNEQINDLLKTGNSGLMIREDSKKGTYVENLTEEVVTSAASLLEIMKKGMRNRHTGSTYMNQESSRSHSIFTITLESRKRSNNIINQRISKLNFVDLAGSERQKQSGTVGFRLKEAGNINKSLTILGCVINSLVESNQRRSRHIPYRDSKLTFILRDSLGGNSKTCMIAAVSSASTSFCETLSTLKFAQRAKLIKNKACVNEESTGNVSSLKLEIKRLKEELRKYLNISLDMSTSMILEPINPDRSLIELNINSLSLNNKEQLLNHYDDREKEKERLFWVLLQKCKEIYDDLQSKLLIKDGIIKNMKDFIAVCSHNEIIYKYLVSLSNYKTDQVDKYAQDKSLGKTSDGTIIESTDSKFSHKEIPDEIIFEIMNNNKIISKEINKPEQINKSIKEKDFLYQLIANYNWTKEKYNQEFTEIDQFELNISEKFLQNKLLMEELIFHLKELITIRMDCHSSSNFQTLILENSSNIFDFLPNDYTSFLKSFLRISDISPVEEQKPISNLLEQERCKFEGLEQDNKRLQEEFETLQASYNYEKEESRRRNESLRVLEQRNNESFKMESELSRDNRLLLEENNILKNKIDELERENEYQKCEKEVLLKNEEEKEIQIFELEEENQALNDKVEAFEIENELIRDEKRELLDQINKFEINAEEMKNEGRNMNLKLESFHNELEQKNKIIIDLEHVIKIKENELEHKNKNIIDLELIIWNKENELEDKNKSIMDIGLVVESKNVEIEQKNKQIASFEFELHDKTKLLFIKQDELNSKNGAISLLQEELNLKKQNISLLLEEVRKMNETMEQKDKTINYFNQELTKTNETLSLLQDELDQKNESIDAIQLEKQTISLEIDVLKQNIKLQQTKLDKNLEINNQLTEELEQVSIENAELKARNEAEIIKLNELLLTIKGKIMERDRKIEVLIKENEIKEQELFRTAINLQEVLSQSKKSFEDLKVLQETKQENEKLKKSLQYSTEENERLDDLYRRLEYQSNIMKANYKIKENQMRKVAEEKKLMELMSSKYSKQVEILNDKIKGMNNLSGMDEIEEKNKSSFEKNEHWNQVKKENIHLKNETITLRELIENYKLKIEDLSKKNRMDPKKTINQLEESFKLKEVIKNLKDEKKMIFDNCEKLNRMICNSNNNECSQCSSSEENDFDQFYFKLEKTIRTLKDREHRVFEKENELEYNHTQLIFLKEEYSLLKKNIELKKTEFSPNRLEIFNMSFRNEDRNEIFSKSDSILKKQKSILIEDFLSIPKKKLKLN